jgi:hypothetical protein
VQGPVTVLRYQCVIVGTAPTANHHRQAFKLRVTQQLD